MIYQKDSSKAEEFIPTKKFWIRWNTLKTIKTTVHLSSS